MESKLSFDFNLLKTTERGLLISCRTRKPQSHTQTFSNKGAASSMWSFLTQSSGCGEHRVPDSRSSTSQNKKQNKNHKSKILPMCCISMEFSLRRSRFSDFHSSKLWLRRTSSSSLTRSTPGSPFAGLRACVSWVSWVGECVMMVYWGGKNYWGKVFACVSKEGSVCVWERER